MSLALSMDGTDLLTAQHAMVVELLFPKGDCNFGLSGHLNFFSGKKRKRKRKMPDSYACLYIHVYICGAR